ncbi:MAG: single-stranded-DNA-specific exonuclease RecJ [Solirubrobacteraceae bacterium]
MTTFIPSADGAFTDSDGASVAAAGARVELPPYDLRAALRLERELGVSHIVAQVLVRRGYAEVDRATAFLNASERHSPECFSGIQEAVETIRRHVAGRGRIVVHGDYDVDGVCATAVMVRALRALSADVGWYLPSRSVDGYGLTAATVQRLAAAGARLLVTVDCGIASVAEVAAAQSAGMEVIVTDHHAMRGDGTLPACTILHPGVCGYPLAELCGTAVAHKLCEALGAPTVDEDLELVALATVADVMPLIGENRRLVREGLARMASTRRPGLRALMAVSRTDPSALDARSVAFRLAPRINAAGRMRRADAALELLLTEDRERAAAVAAELDAVNLERRSVEQRIAWEAESMAAQMGARGAYVLAGAGWHAGVIGIVASRIVERFNRPAILLALDEDPAVPAHGSGRSIPGFDLLGALQATAEHLVSYGGHRAAAGLRIRSDAIDAFRTEFERHAASLLNAELLMPPHRTDAVAAGGDLTLDLAEELLGLGPFGNGNPEVRLYVAGASFDGLRPLGEQGRHVRFNVNSGGVRASAVAFGSGVRIPGADGSPVNASFRLERNSFSGVVQPRVVLAQAEVCQPAPIQVIGQPEGYLQAALMELYRDLDAELEALNDGLLASHADPMPDRSGHTERRPGSWQQSSEQRTVLDRRGSSPLAVIADAQAACRVDSVLVVCADAARRAVGLRGLCGGFALIDHPALAQKPELTARFDQMVVLDPPTSAAQDVLIRVGEGYTHLAWGEPELRFAMQMHEHEYGLRSSLVTLYRSLRERQLVVGEDLEQLLRGDREQRSARLAGRCLRVLTELELVSLDVDRPALGLATSQPTQLERSAAYRTYTIINQEGQRFLNTSRLL